MIRCHRFQKLAGVVDDELSGQALDLRLVLRQLASVELDVGVPAEGMHLRDNLIHDVKAEHPAVEGHDAHRADAGLGEALEAQALLHRLVVLGREMAWKEGTGSAGHFLVIEVHVRVARALRNVDLHCLLRAPLPFLGAAGFGTSSAVQKTPPWWASAIASVPGFSLRRISSA